MYCDTVTADQAQTALVQSDQGFHCLPLIFSDLPTFLVLQLKGLKPYRNWICTVYSNFAAGRKSLKSEMCLL